MRYVAVTLLGGENFETHRDALNFLSEKNAEFKGVFKKHENRVSGVNVYGI